MTDDYPTGTQPRSYWRTLPSGLRVPLPDHGENDESYRDFRE